MKTVESQAVENVTESDSARELVHQFLSGEISGRDLAADLQALFDHEFEYLNSEEYRREIAEADEGDTRYGMDRDGGGNAA